MAKNSCRIQNKFQTNFGGKSGKKIIKLDHPNFVPNYHNFHKIIKKRKKNHLEFWDKFETISVKMQNLGQNPEIRDHTQPGHGGKCKFKFS